MSALSQAKNSTSPGGSQALHHAPMSERQQLALIKRLELQANASNGQTNNDAMLVSPPRAPLQVVNGPNPTTPSSNILQQKFSEERSNFGRISASPVIERLLKKITKRNSKGETPLHTAAIRGSPRLVRQLLVMGADPNAQDHAEWSPLHEACNRGNRGVVRVLLEFGADLNLKGFGKDSPLHDAARNGHLKVVKYLIKSGADIFARNAANRTPREEAEATLQRIDSEELASTAAFLRNEEENRRFNQSMSFYSDVSDDDEDDEREDSDSDGNDDPENEDVAKFLGVTKSSPDVQKAFKSLGLSASKTTTQTYRLTTHTNVTTTTTPSPLKSVLRRESGKKFSNKISLVNGTTPKVRLTYDSDNTSSRMNTAKVARIEPRMLDSSEREEPKTQDSDGDLIQTPPMEKKRRSLNEAENRNSKKKKKKRKIEDELNLGHTSGGGLKVESKSNKFELENDARRDILNDVSSDDISTKASMKVPPLKIVFSNFCCSSDVPDQGVLPLEHHRELPTTLTTGGEIRNFNDEPKMEQSVLFASPCDVPASPNVASTSYSNIFVTSKETAPSTCDVKAQTASASCYPHMKKRKLALLATGSCTTPAEQGPPSDIEKFIEIRKQVEHRRKNLFPVFPKPPEGYKDYLMNRKTYLLHDYSQERLNSIPKSDPPPSLEGPLRDLFVEQENERYKLRIRHIVEKEKLVLAVEQEILRVHGRAARALANQSLPFSVCTILKDDEIYNSINDKDLQDEKARDVRSRFNGRIFLSWLQDVDDKWEKIKEQMVLRHHNEAESLNAVQKMDWEFAVTSLEDNRSNTIDYQFIPMVRVSDDFGLDR